LHLKLGVEHYLEKCSLKISARRKWGSRIVDEPAAQNPVNVVTCTLPALSLVIIEQAQQEKVKAKDVHPIIRPAIDVLLKVRTVSRRRLDCHRARPLDMAL